MKRPTTIIAITAAAGAITAAAFLWGCTALFDDFDAPHADGGRVREATDRTRDCGPPAKNPQSAIRNPQSPDDVAGDTLGTAAKITGLPLLAAAGVLWKKLKPLKKAAAIGEDVIRSVQIGRKALKEYGDRIALELFDKAVAKAQKPKTSAMVKSIKISAGITSVTRAGPEETT